MTDVQPTPAAVVQDPFYEIKLAGKRVLLRIHPPEGGKRASLSDIQKDLRRREVPYRHDVLFAIYKRATNEFEQLASQEITKFDVSVVVSEDRQQAIMTVVAPDRGQDELTPAHIKSALEQANVHKGIRYDHIKDILLEQKGVDHIVIAEGQPKVDGVDGRVELANPPSEQVFVEDNSADYRELNLINNVKEGDLIATIVLPTAGESGFDVHARVLKGRPGRRARLKLGRNVRLSEDGTELFAAKEGYVVKAGPRISVENILELQDVNSETGNIRFLGVVKVAGQVEDGFIVDAGKGIEVGGTVGKATLRSRGDVRIRGGAFGTTVECDGTLYARFLSECKVKSGGHAIIEEYVLHSDVVVRRTVKVTRAPKGFINGGRTKAGSEIWVSNVGSEVSEQPTSLEVGGGVDVRKRYDALQERIDVNLENFDKIRKNLGFLQSQREGQGQLDGRQLELYDRMLDTGHKLIDELLRQAKMHHEMLQALAEPDETSGKIFVAQKANPGTTVQVQTSKVTLRDPVESCAFLLLAGVLKAMPYGQGLKIQRNEQSRNAQKETRLRT